MAPLVVDANTAVRRANTAVPPRQLVALQTEVDDADAAVREGSSVGSDTKEKERRARRRGGVQRRGARSGSRVATRTRIDLTLRNRRVPSRGCARGNARAPRGRGAVAPPRIALASRGFRRARRAEIPPRASRRARGARARSRSRARARQEKEDDSPEIETARPAPRERRTPSRRARDGGRDGVEKGTRAGSRARTSTRRRERAAGGFQWAFARAPRRFSHLSVSCVSSIRAAPSDTPVPSACVRGVRPTDPKRAGGGGFPRHSRWRRMRPRRPSARAGVRRHPPGRAREFTLANARLAPRRRPSRAPLERRIPSRRPPSTEVARGRAPAASSPTDAHGATRPWCEARGAAITARREGGRPRVCVGWRSAPGGGVPLVRIRRALTDPRNTCWSKHNINPEIAETGTLKQIVTVARRTPSLSAMLVRICATYYVRVGSNIKGTDGLVVE